jgi:TRAP transporter 4TM/12TM fusion protein
VSDAARRVPSRTEVAAGVAVAWTLFQLWVASPLPVWLGIGQFAVAQTRSLHLAFALLLCFLLVPAVWPLPGRLARLLDPVLGVAGAFCAGYVFLFYAQLSTRPGDPHALDVALALAGVVLMLEAVRRLLGWPLVLFLLALLAYVWLGPYAPDLIAHKGASIAHTMERLWLGTDAVFGIALGISAEFIFLFVLFGALLESGGGGQYFVRSALALLGHMRGGPAKAAVGVSAATGLFSGASVINVVSTGPLTIPLIKRTGYTPDRAAAIEVASSVNGQVMPPVMGAAAFLMVEYVGIPYVDVLRHALISALVAYAGLLIIVHFEAVKAGLEGLPRQPVRWQVSLRRFLVGLAGMAGVLALLATLVPLARVWLPAAGPLVVGTLLVLAYLLLLRFGARSALSEAVLDAGARSAPGEVLRAGLYFLLPFGLLVWNLVVERTAPAFAVFWALLFLVFIVLTQRPLLVWLREEPRAALGAAWRRGAEDLFDGVQAGARGMLLVAVATAAAGVVVGVGSLTGIGLVMTELVGVLAGGNMVLMLVLVALICLILGMGLPTTANYIVVSALMAPVIVTLGAQYGYPVPLIAAHLFVFYFGLLADVLPPGGLASYAAASIAGANPLQTGVRAFRYSLRMAVLPFMFVFNPQLLLIGVDHPLHAVLTVTAATLGGFVFICFNQAWMLVRTTRIERLILLLASFMLFNPAMFVNGVWPAHQRVGGVDMQAAIAQASAGAQLRLVFTRGEGAGAPVERVVMLTVALEPRATMQEEGWLARFERSGLALVEDEGDARVVGVAFGSPAARIGVQVDDRLTMLERPRRGPSAQWLYLPAVLLVVWVWRRQRLRARPAP